MIPSPYGVISTKHMVTRLLGVLITQIEQADHPVKMKACGATPAIDSAIPLPPAMPLPSALKEKGEQFKGTATLETATGKARISPQGTIQIRQWLLRHCTKNLPPPPNKFGGMMN